MIDWDKSVKQFYGAQMIIDVDLGMGLLKAFFETPVVIKYLQLCDTAFKQNS